MYGADLDPARVATAAERLPGSTVRVADCNGWPFPDLAVTYAIADLDAYSNPYLALEAFLGNATTTDRVVIFGTDGMRQAISRTRMIPSLPSCKGPHVERVHSRPVYNFWWPRHVRPYLERTLAPRRIVRVMQYQTISMLYWGIVADR